MDTVIAHEAQAEAADSLLKAVVARGLALRTRRGSVYEDVDLSVGFGQTAAIVGASGSGRTALLLTLAGRMRPSAGFAEVCGFDIAKSAGRVRKLVGLGIFPGVNDLDETATVAAQVKAELILNHLPHDGRAVHQLLERVGVDAEPHTAIGSLTRAEQLLLGVGLGLLGQPQILMVDGADLSLTIQEQLRVWEVLHRLAENGPTIMTACVEAPLPGCADVVYQMGGLR